MRPTPQRAGERSRHFVLAVHTARHTVGVGDVQGHKLFFGNRDTAGVPARRTRCLGGALCGLPVIIDGLISSVSALLAKRLCPAAADYMIASHLSAEPAAAPVMEALGFVPLLDIGMALGEGTGAVSVTPLIDMALRVYFDMPTFGETGIEEYKPL